ncbi:MAG: hypothetical protein LBL34_07075 [Clostridiales bacterium]|jgi:hypothetical protein|nr:hypothetical protein [Clostridiales bacterium]
MGGGSALTSILISMFGALGIVIIFIGAVIIALGFLRNDGFEQGWNSRKKQGLVTAVSGAMLWSIGQLTGLLNGIGAFESEVFPFIENYAPGLAMAVIAYGIAQIALNMINDDLGSRTWGIRLMVAGAAISQIGNVVDFLLKEYINTPI